MRPTPTPRGTPPEVRAKIIAARLQGVEGRDVASRFGVSLTTVEKIMTAHRKAQKEPRGGARRVPA